MRVVAQPPPPPAAWACDALWAQSPPPAQGSAAQGSAAVHQNDDAGGGGVPARMTACCPGAAAAIGAAGGGCGAGAAIGAAGGGCGAAAAFGGGALTATAGAAAPGAATGSAAIAGAATAGAAAAGAATGPSGMRAAAEEDEPRLSPGPQVVPCCAGAAPAEAGNVLAAPSPRQLAQRLPPFAAVEACLAAAAEEERLEAVPPLCHIIGGTVQPRLCKHLSILAWLGPSPFVFVTADRTASGEGPPSFTSRLARALSNSSTKSALPLPAASISGHLAGEDGKFAAAFASSSHVQIAWQASR